MTDKIKEWVKRQKDIAKEIQEEYADSPYDDTAYERFYAGKYDAFDDVLDLIEQLENEQSVLHNSAS